MVSSEPLTYRGKVGDAIVPSSLGCPVVDMREALTEHEPFKH